MAKYFDLEHCVADEEIDAQQHVHNLRYLQWTLWAAGHTRAGGWDAKAALEEGFGWWFGTMKSLIARRRLRMTS